MSHEVIGRTTQSPGPQGDLLPGPARTTTLPPLLDRPPQPEPQPEPEPERPAGPRDARRAAALCLVLALLAAPAGYAAARAWSGEQAAALLARSGRAEAVAVGPVLVSPEAGRTRLGWAVLVTNPGRGAVRVRLPRPSEVPAGEPGWLRASPREATVAPRASVRVVVETVVPCAGRDPIPAPTLLARPDGTAAAADTPVAVTGGWTLAVRACAPLTLAPDGLRRTGSGELDVRLAPRSGRAWRVAGVRAAGLTLDVAGTRRIADDGGTLRLAVPAGTPCTAAWTTAGVPQTLTVQVAGPEPVDVAVRAGPGLAAWLLDTACPP